MLTIAPPRPTVTRFFEAFAAGDVSQLDTLVTEDVEVSLGGLLYEREVYRGRSGVAAAFREIAARWHRFEATVEDVVETDERLYVTVNTVTGKYDMASEMPMAIVCELRDGLIASIADDDELYDVA
jgi:ketosteroid isomerase-like protein